MSDDQKTDGTSFDVRTHVTGGAGSLHIDARIATREGWNAFCEAINAQGLALWPQEDEPAPPEKKPRVKGQNAVKGDPAPDTMDGRVLAFARQYVTDNGRWPSRETVADVFDLQSGVAAMSIGRLKGRGVWLG